MKLSAFEVHHASAAIGARIAEIRALGYDVEILEACHVVAVVSIDGEEVLLDPLDVCARLRARAGSAR